MVQQPAAKTPRTDRGRRTRRALLDAAATEFGDHGFASASISGITRRAGTALGSFYTYFDSKEAVFRALVADLSAQVGAAAGDAVAAAPDAMAAERAALTSFLRFTREHREIYRIVDEAEFVDPSSWRAHYEGTAARILARLTAGWQRGELARAPVEADAWAIMGANVFLGLRFGFWDDSADLEAVADHANELIARGLARGAGDTVEDR